MEPPTAPDPATRVIASAAACGLAPYPFSRSTETGSRVARSSARACSTTSSNVVAPSARPSVNANPELVLASAGKPSAASTFAEPASHGLGMRNTPSACSARKASAFSRCDGCIPILPTRSRLATRYRAGVGSMLAWEVRTPGPIAGRPLRAVRREVPEPGPGEALVRVLACAVCRTDLHVAEGDLPPHRSGIVPGHEVVGTVEALGPQLGGPQTDGAQTDGPRDSGVGVGERVGIAWLRHTCGECVYCRQSAENLCPRSEYTGWDADGRYA